MGVPACPQELSLLKYESALCKSRSVSPKDTFSYPSSDTAERCVCAMSGRAQRFVTPMGCSLVHGILQARPLEWAGHFLLHAFLNLPLLLLPPRPSAHHPSCFLPQACTHLSFPETHAELGVLILRGSGVPDPHPPAIQSLQNSQMFKDTYPWSSPLSLRRPGTPPGRT